MKGMNTFSPPKAAVAVGVLSLAFVMSLTPVLARDGVDDNSGTSRHHTETRLTVEDNTSTSEAEMETTEVANETHNNHMPEQVQARIASKEAELKLRLQDKQEAIKEKLTNAKLQACQNRAAAISKHLTNSTKAATNLEGKFAAIATKAEQFKTDKNVTVPNYDQLVADVTAKKTSVDTAVAAAQTAASTFSCTSDGPKAQLQAFVSGMDAVRQTLKDYRDAVRNLIQGIRQANGQNRQASDSTTPSSTPSATPEGGKE
jgi:hypothetical protein